MKKLYFPFLILLVTTTYSNAQRYMDTHDPNEIRSLLGKGNDLKGYGGIDLKLTDLKGTRGLLTGAYGGLVVNRNYLLAIAGYGLVTENEFDGFIPGDSVSRNLNLYGGYGGVIFGATILSKEMVHLSIPVLFGAGAAEVSDRDYFSGLPGDSDFTIENSVFFVIEPQAQLEINMTSFFRIAAGVSYRYVTGSDLVNVTDDDLSGIAATLSFRFGRF